MRERILRTAPNEIVIRGEGAIIYTVFHWHEPHRTQAETERSRLRAGPYSLASPHRRCTPAARGGAQVRARIPRPKGPGFVAGALM